MEGEKDNQLIDDVLVELGIGKFLIINYIFVCLPIIFSTISGTTFVFTARDTSYRCLLPECEDASASFDQTWLSAALPFEGDLPRKCERFPLRNSSVIPDDATCDLLQFDETIVERCSEWAYGEGDSIVGSYDIPCEDWKRSMVGTINSVGQFVALLFCGVLSDRYGRRVVMVIATSLIAVAGSAQAFAPDYWSFLVAECLNAVVSAAAYSSAYVLGIEIMSPTKRVYGSAIMNCSCTVGTLLLGIIAWITPTWRYLLVVGNIPPVLTLLAFLTIPESLRWLYAKNRRWECFKIIKRAAHMNKVTLSPEILNKMEKAALEIGDSAAPHHTTDANFIDMIKTPTLLIRLVACAFCWFTNVLVYYGLSLNSVNIGTEENVYLNFIYVTLVELPGYIFYLIILRYIGRKLALILTLTASGIACLIYALTNLNYTISLLLYLASKMFISTSFALVYIYTSELFPTSLRNSSMSLCSVFGRIGGGLAPQVPLLNAFHSSLPMITYGIVPIISAITLISLPETKDKKLPDTLREAVDLR